jgi:hypothetical protein
VTLGWRDAIPTTVGPVRPPPCSQHHAGHCYNHSGAMRHAGTGRRHACHCIPYGSLSTTSSSTVWGRHGQPLRPYPRSCHCSGTRYAMMAKIVARTVKVAANSVALHTILPHVAE